MGKERACLRMALNAHIVFLFLGGGIFVIGAVLFLLDIWFCWEEIFGMLGLFMALFGCVALLGCLLKIPEISYEFKTASVCVVCNEKHSNIFYSDKYCDKCGSKTERVYKKCLVCDTKATENMSTCNNCGTSLLEKENAAFVAMKAHKCLQCDTKNKKDALYCKSCGGSLIYEEAGPIESQGVTPSAPASTTSP